MVFRFVVLIIILLNISVESIAQTNVFLNRDYWKNNPSITKIVKDVSARNSLTALNKHAFDAVSYALLENVDNATIEYLLTIKGNGVNKLTHDARTYIFWAAYRDNLNMMKYLVNNGAKTDLIDSHGYSLLNFTAVTGQLNTKLYDFCIVHGADVINEKNHDGANALLLVAPFLKDGELIDYFTSKGIDLHSTDTNGNGIFNYACKNIKQNVLNLLIKKGVASKSPNKKGGNAFIFASQGTRRNSNTLENYKYLERMGLKPNITTDNGFTPLHALGYKNKDLDIFEYFIKKGVDVDQKDINGNTAFINASYRNDLKSVSFLAEHVKDINIQNKKGHSALTRAIHNNTFDVVSFLINKDASVSTIDINGNSLLYYLLDSYNTNSQDVFKEKLQLLKTKNLDFSASQQNENTLWHLAVKKNDVALLKMLVEFKSSINHANNEGYTPLHIAAMKAFDTKIMKFLLKHGADKTIKTEFEETPLDLANENEQLQKNKSNLIFLQ